MLPHGTPLAARRRRIGSAAARGWRWPPTCAGGTSALANTGSEHRSLDVERVVLLTGRVRVHRHAGERPDQWFDPTHTDGFARIVSSARSERVDENIVVGERRALEQRVA